MSDINVIVDRIVTLEKKMEEVSSELQVVKNKNKSLKLQLYKLTDSNYDLHDFVYNLENQINELNQYSR